VELTGKKVLVTGGANGIGRRLVEKLTDEGAAVGVFDVDGGALERLRADRPGVCCKACDVTDPAQVSQAVEELYGELGAVHVLVNNAGMIHNSLLVGMGEGGLVTHDYEMWDKTIAANLSSVFYVASEVVRRMVCKRTRGVIVNVSSICAAGNVGQSAYSAAKAGVRALTVTWAKELGYFGIRVAGIAPGFTETDAVKLSMSESVLKEWTKQTPMRRMATPCEIADGVLFIIRNDMFDGRTLELDGGLRM